MLRILVNLYGIYVMRHITFTFIGARDAQGMLHTLFYKLDSFDIYIYA